MPLRRSTRIVSKGRCVPHSNIQVHDCHCDLQFAAVPNRLGSRGLQARDRSSEPECMLALLTALARGVTAAVIC